MKKIAVVTTTRAEYGLLSPVIKELRKNENDDFKVELIVTGTHLSDKYGKTVEEINDRIEHQISISVNSDSEKDISANQAEALVKFTESPVPSPLVRSPRSRSESIHWCLKVISR